MLLAAACLRVLVGFSPDLYWMTDPRQDSLPTIGFGATGALVTDWLAVAAMGLAVLDSFTHGRRVHTVWLLLWAVGSLIGAWHGGRDFESLRITSHWSAALAAAIAAAHLASNPVFRRILLAGILATAVPLSIQAVRQVTIEHAQSVEDYMKNRPQRLAERGWEPGSTEARKFEERLKQREASGRIGLSNVFASVTMSLSVLAGGLAFYAARNFRRSPLQAVVPGAILAVLAFTSLAMTFSKGAAVAMGATVLALGVMRVMPAFKHKWALTGWLILASGIGGILARGAMGEPETAAGERSLLFRAHYLQASSRMVLEQPWLGVGPGQYQQRYILHKNPKNPEEVSDPHNVFASYIATLGVGGWAWGALLVAILWRAGRACGTHRHTDESATDATSRDAAARSGGTPGTSAAWAWILAVAVLVFGTEYIVTLAVLGVVGLVVLGAVGVFGLMSWAAWAGKIKGQEGRPMPGGRKWGVVLGLAALLGPALLVGPLGAWLWGAVGFAVAARWLVAREELDAQAMRLVVLAAACAVLLHAQIEMSLTNMMAALFLMTLVGTAAGGDAPEKASPRARGFGLILALTAAAAFLIFPMGAGVYKDSIAARAAQQFKRFSPAASDSFEAMRRGLAPDLRAVRYESQFRMETQGPDAALAALEEAKELGLRPAMLLNIESTIAEEAYRRTQKEDYLRRAYQSLRLAAEYDPFNMVSQAQLGELALRLGEKQSAAEHFRRALELNALAYLDPNKQFSEAELSAIMEKQKQSEE